ncbi:MAG: helix-turn-helix domain-containing protein [Caenibius sp.]
MNTQHKIAYTVPEALAAIGIGRTNLYKLAHEGKIDLRKVGSRTLVTAASLHRLIEEAPAA